MPGTEIPRPVGYRPRWPDLVILGAIVALGATGVVALFGEAIRGWFAEESAPAAAGGPGVIPGPERPP
jgi:hypothetical protein